MLYNTPGFEGFFAISAVRPDHKNLIIFPEKLLKGSHVQHVDANGKTRFIRAKITPED